MDDLAADAWAQLDHLVATGIAPEPFLRKPTHHRSVEAVVCSDGHVCSAHCFFLQAQENDSAFVCTLSGLTWGTQISNGSFDKQHHVDHPGLEQHQQPRGAKRKTEESDNHYELYSSCVRMLYRLLKPAGSHDKVRIAKAAKNALKLEATLIKQCRSESAPVLAMDVLCASFAEVERAGGGIPEAKIGDRRLHLLANSFCKLYEKFICAYAREVSKKPTRDYFACAACYLFAEGIGSYRDELLATRLPESKHLKQYNLEISRVTSAKRCVYN